MNRWIGQLVAAFILCSACTEVELCYNAEHPHTLPLSIDFDWGKTAAEEKPDSMYMVFSRIINTRHYVYGVSSEGWKEETGVIPETPSEGLEEDALPEETLLEDENVTQQAESGGEPEAGGEDGASEGEGDEEAPETGEEEDEPQEETIRVEGGDYIVITVNKNHDLVELVEEDAFKTDNAVRLDSLRLRVNGIVYPDLPGFDTEKWNNLNPAYTYIANTGKLFSSVERWSIFAGTSILMSPEPVTQHLTFRFSLGLEEETGVSIDRVACELSGVVDCISLSTKEIREVDSRHSVCFMAEKTDDSDASSPVYEGSVDVLGLFPNKSQASIYGAGIIQLSIAVSKGSESRIHTVRLNLIHLLTSANLVVASEDGETLLPNPDIQEMVFDIGRLEVDFDRIMNSEGNEGLFQWVVIEDGGTDIEI